MKCLLNRGSLWFVVAVILTLSIMPANAAFAFDNVWNRAFVLPPGAWNTTTFWTPASVPEADFDEQAIINNGATTTVAVPATSNTGGIILGVAANQSGRILLSTGGSLLSRLPDPGEVPVPSVTSFGNVLVGQAGRGYIDMTGGTLCVGANATTCVAAPNAAYTAVNNLIVDGEELATGLGRSRVNLSGTANLHVTGISTLNRNLRITGPSVNFRTAGNVNFGGTSIFTPEITGVAHSPIFSGNVINLGGQIAVTYTGVTPAHNQSWTLAEAANFNGVFTNESAASRDVIPIGVPAPVLGEAYRLRETGGATGGNRQLQVGYQKLLVLTVDRTAGVETLTIRNPLSGPISIDGYSISSTVGSMSTGWNSLDDQNIWGGDWEELAPTVNSLSEFKPSSSFAPGSSQSLGLGFDRDAVGALGIGISGEDLVFEYAVPSVGIVRGQVEYIGTPFLNNIGLLVDPANGNARLKNDSGVPLDIEAYRIVSTTNSLTPGTWTSLDSQLPGWQAGTGTTFGLAEALPEDSMTITAQQFFGLGDIGNFTTPAQMNGLRMEFILEGEANFRLGTVLFAPFPGGVPGDYNGNNIVDAADYTVWRNHLGMTGGATAATGDGNGDGNVTAADYDYWKARFGNTSGSGGGSLASSSAVPEPTTGCLFLVGFSVILFAIRRRFGALPAISVHVAICPRTSGQSGVVDMSRRLRKLLDCRSFAVQCTRAALALGAVIGLSWIALPATAQNLLVNGTFEAPALGKFEVGYDPVPVGFPGLSDNPGAGTDIPGWHSNGFDITTITWNALPRDPDTGIEVAGQPLPGSIYSGFMNGADTRAGLYASQTTSHVITTADAFNLSIFARPLFTFIEGFAANANATMHWQMYYGGTDSTRGTVFAEGFFDLGLGNAGPYSLYSSGSIVPPVAAVGSIMGISLLNSSGGYLGDPAGAVPAAPQNSWIGFDNTSLERVSSVFGDVDFDADVDTADLQIILNNMSNSTASFWSEGDINGDDLVNLLDYRAWKNVFAPGFGAGGSAAGVPEPSTLALTLIISAAIGLGVRRKRKGETARRTSPLLSLALGILASLSIALPSDAQPMALPNPDFELHTEVPPVKTEFWDATGAIVNNGVTISGWFTTGPGDPEVLGGPIAGPGDSGYEQGGVNDFDTTVGDLDWRGYLAAQDPSIYTVSTTNIVANRNYVASMFLNNIFQGDGQAARVNLELFYVNASSVRVPLGNQNYVVGPGFTNYSLTLTSAQVAAGLGRPLGIEIDHVGNESIGRELLSAWIALDHVVLYADNVLGGAGDVNNDGVVNSTDYGIIKTNFHQAVPSREMGDISGPTGTSDLFVDLYDLRAWKDSVGSGSGGLAGGLGVPEPSTWVTSMFTALLIAGWRRRHRKQLHLQAS